MLFDPPLQSATLLRRYQRFLADVLLPDGTQRTLHCPNTGSMKNCLFPGETVWFSDSGNPQRKYPCTWELAQTSHGDLIGINTGRANALAEEAIRAGVITELQGYAQLQREVRYGEENSRIDIKLTQGTQADCFVEVKSATLLEGDCGFFPDAVTTRGQKHLRELISVVAKGQRGVLLFVVQHSGIKKVAVARHIDPLYAQLLVQARAQGVEVLVYAAAMSPKGLQLYSALPFTG